MIKKLWSTLRILFCLGMARTFGQYQHSGWNGEFEFAKYQWCGRYWVIPLGPDEEYSYKLRWGFKSKKQLAIFMVWREHIHKGEVEYANVLFTTRDWIGC